MIHMICWKKSKSRFDWNINKLGNRFKVIMKKIMKLTTLKERIARIYTRYTTPLHEPTVQFMYETHTYQSGNTSLCGNETCCTSKCRMHSTWILTVIMLHSNSRIKWKIFCYYCETCVSEKFTELSLFKNFSTCSFFHLFHFISHIFFITLHHIYTVICFKLFLIYKCSFPLLIHMYNNVVKYLLI